MYSGGEDNDDHFSHIDPDEEYDNHRDDPGVYLCFTTSMMVTTVFSSRSESQYNEGKGIHYIVKFQPQTPLPKASGKRRKNAKKPNPINCQFYLHEESCLSEVLDTAIEAIGRDQDTMKFKIISGNLRSTHFSVKWTVNRSTCKDMQLMME
ncbi:hypothetical protein B0H10DRAFT_1955698 [Mycena sp. CBHHK59/15]|nr:hypothetical protein B0H10DRAFT_1955698 [Mycena sp. CBHHK59/15]